MISRRIHRKPEHDNYRRLARYIADASHDGEKALMSWCAGCWSGDDEYELAIGEVEATQVLNTRTTKEKTYHLMISFRPEDEARLTPEIFEAIELEFAKILGFEEHQRHCGVHKNTDNLHIHIAYNQIHPRRLTRHEPYFDYLARDKLCRTLERKYGLSVDKGRDSNSKKTGHDAAQAFEAHTGQESLFGYAQRLKAEIMPLLDNAKSWGDCHSIFIKYGLTLKPHGNGLVLRDHEGKHSIKASDFDRSVSKTKLEKRLGAFEPPSQTLPQGQKSITQYNAAPLQKDPDRDGLYQLFQSNINKRRVELDAVNQQEKRLYAIYQKQWGANYKNITGLPMLRKHRQKLMKDFKAKKQRELDALRRDMKAKREAIRQRFPYHCWSQFLQSEAAQGNETALAILRSKKTTALAERKAAPTQTALAAVDKMLQIFRAEGIQKIKYKVDAKGTIIFPLPSGGTIRDTGKEIHFSQHDAQAKILAEKLAQSRWGQAAILKDGLLCSKNNLGYTPVQRQPTSGLSR